MDVAFVTCAALPDLVEDDLLLLRELQARGVAVAPLVWDDPMVDWSKPSLCLIRETWDYHLRLDEYLAWLSRAEEQSRVLNAPELVRWNSQKCYLRDLERRGIDTVPTQWLKAGTQVNIGALISERDWDRFVIKPSVSASSFETALFPANEIEKAEAHIERLLPTRELMVQPFMRSVHDYGERSLIFIDGAYTHAVRRPEPFMGDEMEHASRPAQAMPEEIDFAVGVLDVLIEIPLYARIDIAPDDQGRLRLMELELIEPSLFFQFSPEAVKLMADDIERRLHARGESRL